jgi:hypothetical protein
MEAFAYDFANAYAVQVGIAPYFFYHWSRELNG